MNNKEKKLRGEPYPDECKVMAETDEFVKKQAASKRFIAVVSLVLRRSEYRSLAGSLDRGRRIG